MGSIYSQQTDQKKEFLRAAIDGKEDIVKEFLNTQSTGDDFVLSEACRRGRLIIVKMLVNHGFSLENSDALIEAVKSGNAELVAWLLDQGIDIHHKQDQALVEAVEHKETKIFQLLMERGASLHTQDDVISHMISINGFEIVRSYLL